MNIDRIKEVTAELNRTTAENIVAVGYGYKQINDKTLNERCISFTVTKKLPLSEIPENERIPNEIEIDGEIFKTDVVEGEIFLQAFIDCSDSDPSFYSWQTTPPNNRNKIRPLQGGVSVTNYTSNYSSTGTLGFIAVDNDTNTLVGVSNNHVLIDNAFYASSRSSDAGKTISNVVGDISTQPNESGNRLPSHRIGIIKKYEPILPVDMGDNYVDAACLSLDSIDGDGNTTITEEDSWKQYGIVGLTSAPRFATTQEIDSALNNPNQVFYGSGRTTGAKGEGLIKLYCVDSAMSVSLSYASQEGRTTARMNESFKLYAKGPDTPEGDWCTYPSNSGDSGSAVLTEINGEYVIIGLLYAGQKTLFGFGPSISTICCRIDRVVEALNISAWNGSLDGVSFSNNNASERLVVEGKSSEKTIIVGGKKYWQVGVTLDVPNIVI